MKQYHKYIFDFENRTMVGHFEQMYAQESVETFEVGVKETCECLESKFQCLY